MLAWQRLIQHSLLIYCLSIFVCFILGKATTFVLFSISENSYRVIFGSTFFGEAITGILVGITQWQCLQRQVLPVKGWLLASSIGWIVGSTLTVVISNHMFGVVNLALFGHTSIAVVWILSGTIGGAFGGAFGGLLLGLAQWVFLRMLIPGSYNWILINLLSGMLSSAISSLMSIVLFDIYKPILECFSSSIIYGMITGIVLIYGMRKE